MTNVVIVGTGFMGPTHTEALRRLGITVRGIMGSSPEKSQQAAQQLGLDVAYSDYQDILDDDLVDAIHVATPNKLHFDMAKRALLADKHVVCEKPLAMNSQETAELVEVARSKPNLIDAVNYNIRFYPAVFQAREIVRNGELGEIFTLRGAYLQDWLLFDTDWNWRLVPEEGGDLRAIGDIGTHWMDLMAFVTGLRVESVLADLKTFIPTRKKPRQAVATFEQAGSGDVDEVTIRTDDWGAVIFHYAGGARGTMNVSQVNAGRKNQLSFEIAGSKGAIAWDGERPNELWIGHRERPNEILIKDPSLLSGDTLTYTDYPGGHAEGYPDSFKMLYRAVYDYLHTGDFSKPKPFPTFADGHQEIVISEAILASHRERRWVSL
jgi:predicted dehydrogenase